MVEFSLMMTINNKYERSGFASVGLLLATALVGKKRLFIEQCLLLWFPTSDTLKRVLKKFLLTMVVCEVRNRGAITLRV